ncbi:hypothetical protein SAMN05216167_15211 [Spirosoma endophyticum]|uniref:Uncharacterized protein n=1 Tax=Spirosoma endophyticum TaxID=662367 RepID=A0A1I2I0T5_9BACT|nr:hypothetical protein SAMN05216167_15211 [Spirosoma endophyticum]
MYSVYRKATRTSGLSIPIFISTALIIKAYKDSFSN